MAPVAGTPSTLPTSACAASAWSGSGAGARAICARSTTPCAPGAPSTSGLCRSPTSRPRPSGIA
eukprot:843614-Alexandrium_andersonii.AAC.1